MANHALATVDNPSSALTDFTLIVDLSDMPTDWWTANNTSDGTRGRVYKGDGSTRLACDWIDFDNSAETGFLRVLWSGTLATTGTQQLWIEPPVSGNDAVADNATYGADNAYISTMENYLPMQDDFNDRTSNGVSWTTYGGVSAGGATGQFGNATEFDDTDDYLDTSDIDAMLEFTAILWLYTDGGTYNRALWEGKYGGRLHTNASATTLEWSGRITDYTVTDTISTSTWHQVAVTFDSDGNATIKIDDGTAESDAVGTLNEWDEEWTIGNRSAGSFAGWNGRIQDVKIYSEVLSDAWADEEYDQTNDNSTFWGTWSWETDAGGGIEIPVVHHHLIMQGGQ